MENKPKLLVIDDDHTLRENFKYLLEKNGYEVQTAQDGIDGLKKLENFTPDLIVLDINMPRMGGIEFYQKIFDGYASKYPVFVLTARANMEQLFKELKVEGFMTKPFEMNDFIQEVKLIIKKLRPAPNEIKQRKTKSIHTVCLADDDSVESGKISIALLEAGFRVSCAKSGTAMLELIFSDPPDIALVKFGLKDIPGDTIAQYALHMTKTTNVKFLLYQKIESDHLDVIREKFASKKNVLNLVDYGDPVDLVNFLNDAIQKIQEEAEDFSV
ncbi:MAG: response regulator [Candidatus Omnitrophica bacterium]|nr:response regulator [Candidatus Omnitrophota bacterium]